MLHGLYNRYGTHVLPGMNPEQARRARRWEKPSLLVALLIIPTLIAHIEGWAGRLPQALLVGITAFLVVEMLDMVRLSSWGRWASANLLDIVVLLAALSALPFGPEPIWGWVSVLMVLRVLDLLPVVNRHFVHISPLGFAFTVMLVIIIMGAMAFTQVEWAESGKHIDFIASLYWASSTVIAVGYGDITPSGHMAMVVAILFQIAGLVGAALLVAAAVELFSRQFALAFLPASDGKQSPPKDPLPPPARWSAEDHARSEPGDGPEADAGDE